MLLIDTEEYAGWLTEEYGVDRDRIRLVPTGADDRAFRPAPVTPDDRAEFHVVYYGSFIPNHGLEYVVEAASLLREQMDIRFLLIGEGPEKRRLQRFARSRDLSTVRFLGWMDHGQLTECLQEADLLLGSFGRTPQALMTVQNKVYEGLAMAKPVLTGDSPAIRRAFDPGSHLLVCERANPESIAQAILSAKRDRAMRVEVAKRGHARFRQHFTPEHIGARVRAALTELLGEGP
jgi:glycosyltransferase involved in cell wall biosynthesis